MCAVVVDSADELRRFRSVDRSWFSVKAYNTGCTETSRLRQLHSDPARCSRRRWTSAWSGQTSASSRSCRRTSSTSQVSGVPPTVLGVSCTAVNRAAEEDTASRQQVRLRGLTVIRLSSASSSSSSSSSALGSAPVHFVP